MIWARIAPTCVAILLAACGSDSNALSSAKQTRASKTAVESGGAPTKPGVTTSKSELDGLPHTRDGFPTKLPLLRGRLISPYRDLKNLDCKDEFDGWKYAVHPKIKSGPRRFASDKLRIGVAHSWICDRYRMPPDHQVETSWSKPGDWSVGLVMAVRGWRMLMSSAELTFDGTMVRKAQIRLRSFRTIPGTSRTVISAEKAKAIVRQHEPSRSLGEPTLVFYPKVGEVQWKYLSEDLDMYNLLCPHWMFPGSRLIVNALTGEPYGG